MDRRSPSPFVRVPDLGKGNRDGLEHHSCSDFAATGSRALKFTDHWEEEEEDGTNDPADRERFSQELPLVFANGKTQVLTHEKKRRPRRELTTSLRH